MRLSHLIRATLLGAAMAMPAITPAAFAQSTPATAPITAPTTMPLTGTRAANAAAAKAAADNAAAANAAAANAAAANAAKTATAAVKPVGAPVNVNTASIEELKALPGIGKSRSKAIVAGRPYTSVDQIDSKKIVPHSVFEKIKGQLAI